MKTYELVKVEDGSYTLKVTFPSKNSSNGRMTMTPQTYLPIGTIDDVIALGNAVDKTLIEEFGE